MLEQHVPEQPGHKRFVLSEIQYSVYEYNVDRPVLVTPRYNLWVCCCLHVCWHAGRAEWAGATSATHRPLSRPSWLPPITWWRFTCFCFRGWMLRTPCNRRCWGSYRLRRAAALVLGCFMRRNCCQWFVWISLEWDCVQIVPCLSDRGEGSCMNRERQTDRERGLMDVSASADKLPPERLLVAIETPGKEIKKGWGLEKTCFFTVASQPLACFAHLVGEIVKAIPGWCWRCEQKQNNFIKKKKESSVKTSVLLGNGEFEDFLLSTCQHMVVSWHSWGYFFNCFMLLPLKHNLIHMFCIIFS